MPRATPRPQSPPPKDPPPRKLITAPLAGSLALAVIFGYLFAVAIVPPSTDPSTPTDPLYSPSASPSSPCHAPTGRPTSLSGLSALDFDRELDREEKKAGVTALRGRLVGRATGHVLEVAVGTGRNFGHYDWAALAGVTPPMETKDDGKSKGKGKGEEEKKEPMLSFTGVDIASDMLEVAASKLKAAPLLKKAEPSVTVLKDEKGDVAAGAISFLADKIRLVKSDAQTYLPPPPPTPSPPSSSPPTGKQDPYYDTIIQTFGLCSVTSPKTILSNLTPLLRPETGRILLLEHGRGTWGAVNWWLDRHAARHFGKYGCWWNRDLEGAVREACGERVGGRKVEVVGVERPGGQMGTVLWIELKVVEG